MDAPGPFSLAVLTTALPRVALVLFVVGLVTVVVGHRRGERVTGPLEHLPSILGWAALMGHLVLQVHELGRLPVGNLHESSVFLALLLASSYLLGPARRGFVAVEALLLVLVIAFLGLSVLIPGAPVAVAPATAGNRWFVLHVMLAFLGVTALLGSCIVSVLYLLAEWQLKTKRPSVALRLLPSLVVCDRAALRLLSFGFPLLTLGIVSGWVWGRLTGRPIWQAKELWALVAWAIYAALLFARVVRGWGGRKAAMLAVAGAFAVLVAFLGIQL